jgi:hypothetical protein
VRWYTCSTPMRHPCGTPGGGHPAGTPRPALAATQGTLWWYTLRVHLGTLGGTLKAPGATYGQVTGRPLVLTRVALGGTLEGSTLEVHQENTCCLGTPPSGNQVAHLQGTPQVHLRQFGGTPMVHLVVHSWHTWWRDSGSTWRLPGTHAHQALTWWHTWWYTWWYTCANLVTGGGAIPGRALPERHLVRLRTICGGQFAAPLQAPIWCGANLRR